MNSEFRKDYIHNRWVIIAPKRSRRPHDVEKTQRTKAVNKKDCVFCPGKIDKNNVVLETVTLGQKPWAIKVIKNKYPSVSTDNPKAYGQQEVVVETPNHQKEIEELPIKTIAEIFKVYARRTQTISKDKKIDYILTFKNSGGAAGASLQHSHSQIFATEMVPPRMQEKTLKIKEYHQKTGRCIYCDIIKKEKKGPRHVFEDDNMVAFCPWAPMHNYEIWLMPKRHVDNITLLNDDEIKSLAEMLKKILKKINKLGLPYNYYFHQVISDTHQHLYLKIKPRGSVWASVEIGAGFIINPVSPEEAAKFYRGK
ncbi:MAG: galactose-1-phosphate uridylyltransferase [Candidatus Buchananbacteria bacterium]|nr:galactose-1-phosphate uridylyltransferase [Candidatus Buchananbacteria bacterium]